MICSVSSGDLASSTTTVRPRADASRRISSTANRPGPASALLKVQRETSRIGGEQRSQRRQQQGGEECEMCACFMAGCFRARCPPSTQRRGSFALAGSCVKSSWPRRDQCGGCRAGSGHSVVCPWSRRCDRA